MRSRATPLRVVEVVLDCDEDAVLVRANADGPACHDGSTSCFTPWLWRRILQREAQGDEHSYVATMLREGTPLIARKVGEEAVETVVASLSEDDERVVSEAADLWFHTLRTAAQSRPRPGCRRGRTAPPGSLIGRTRRVRTRG